MGTLSKTVGFSLYPSHWVPGNLSGLWLGRLRQIAKTNKNKVIGCLPEKLPVQFCLPAQKNAVKLIQKENMRLEKLGEGVASFKRRGRW